MEDGLEKTRKQKLEITNRKLEIGNWQAESHFRVSIF
jgi:hypothetical protein